MSQVVLSVSLDGPGKWSTEARTTATDWTTTTLLSLVSSWAKVERRT
jgi:hypothetical protein